jgi:hypothetical protein
MRSLLRNIVPFVFAASVLTASFAMAGCSVHARVYDPYYNDYHSWDHETVYYNQWEVETKRPHVDYQKRQKDDQKAYWDWRHSHPDQH